MFNGKSVNGVKVDVVGGEQEGMLNSPAIHTASLPGVPGGVGECGTVGARVVSGSASMLLLYALRAFLSNTNVRVD